MTTINTNNILNNLQTNLIKLSAQNKVDDKDTADKILHDTLESNISSSTQEVLNFNDAVGYMQVADGVLSNVSDQVAQLNTLSVASKNGALNSDQQASLQSQMQDLSSTISQTLNETTYNSKPVFSGDFTTGNMSINLNINTNSLDITNQDSILDFQQNIDSVRGDISAFMNGANANIDNLTTQITSQANSKSNFEVDVAKSANDIQKDKLQLNASLLAQAHNTDVLASKVSSLLQ
ncbi:MAG: hypothetical protein GXO40_02835 [Epsilonproteobacteria bacterium]|nr:hypothetical protein [Campylobacterota bacterium]